VYKSRLKAEVGISEGQNQIAIRFSRNLNRMDDLIEIDSNLTLFDLATF